MMESRSLAVATLTLAWSTWRGAFDAGRAPVLKRLLETASCPLLLVRGSNGSHTTLMVGKDIDD